MSAGSTAQLAPCWPPPLPLSSTQAMTVPTHCPCVARPTGTTSSAATGCTGGAAVTASAAPPLPPPPLPPPSPLPACLPCLPPCCAAGLPPVASAAAGDGAAGGAAGPCAGAAAAGGGGGRSPSGSGASGGRPASGTCGGLRTLSQANSGKTLGLIRLSFACEREEGGKMQDQYQAHAYSKDSHRQPPTSALNANPSRNHRVSPAARTRARCCTAGPAPARPARGASRGPAPPATWPWPPRDLPRAPAQSAPRCTAGGASRRRPRRRPLRTPRPAQQGTRARHLAGGELAAGPCTMSFGRRLGGPSPGQLCC